MDFDGKSVSGEAPGESESGFLSDVMGVVVAKDVQPADVGRWLKLL
jgi:hypothetical protein